jgi:hypothetical protein
MSRTLRHRLSMCWWILTNRPVTTIASWDQYSGYELQLKFRKYRKDPYPMHLKSSEGPYT